MSLSSRGRDPPRRTRPQARPEERRSPRKSSGPSRMSLRLTQLQQTNHDRGEEGQGEDWHLEEEEGHRARGRGNEPGSPRSDTPEGCCSLYGRAWRRRPAVWCGKRRTRFESDDEEGETEGLTCGERDCQGRSAAPQCSQVLCRTQPSSSSPSPPLHPPAPSMQMQPS